MGKGLEKTLSLPSVLPVLLYLCRLKAHRSNLGENTKLDRPPPDLSSPKGFALKRDGIEVFLCGPQIFHFAQLKNPVPEHIPNSAPFPEALLLT